MTQNEKKAAKATAYVLALVAVVCIAPIAIFGTIWVPILLAVLLGLGFAFVFAGNIWVAFAEHFDRSNDD